MWGDVAWTEVVDIRVVAAVLVNSEDGGRDEDFGFSVQLFEGGLIPVLSYWIGGVVVLLFFNDECQYHHQPLQPLGRERISLKSSRVRCWE